MSNDSFTMRTVNDISSKSKRIETEVLLTENMKLSITTYKKSGDACLRTIALVSHRHRLVRDVNNAPFWHLGGKDYYRVFEAAKIRGTVKAVKTQHQKYLNSLDNIVEDVKKHYGVTTLTG